MRRRTAPPPGGSSGAGLASTGRNPATQSPNSPAPNVLAAGHGGNEDEVRPVGRGRVRGLAAWQPRAKSLVLLEQVKAVLREYIEHLPLTIRQIFYRLVGAYAYEKTEKAYDSLAEMLNRARRAGRVPWSAIRDDGFEIKQPTAWDDADDLIDAI